MDAHKTLPYTKMKVTGLRSAEMPLTSNIQEYDNPTIKAIVQTTNEMDTVLARGAITAKPTMGRRRNRASGKHIAPSSAVAIHNTCLERLRALKSQFDQTYNPLLRLLIQQRQQQAPVAAAELPGQPVGAAAQPSTSTADESSAGSITMRDRVLQVIPKMSKAKYALLWNYLKENPDIIRVSAGGRPIINGRELAGSSFVDVMHSLYMWRKQTALPHGAYEIIQALQSVGVPSTLLSSTAARNLYQDVLNVQEESETYDSPDEDTEMQYVTPGVQPMKHTVSQTKIPSSASTSATQAKITSVPLIPTAQTKPPIAAATAPIASSKPLPVTQPSTIQQGKGHPKRWPGTRPAMLYLYKD